MSHVLGLVIRNIFKTYQKICHEKKIPAIVQSLGPLHYKDISMFKRYEWEDFVVTLEGITAELGKIGVDSFEFQKRLIPKIFGIILATRFGRHIFTPASLIKGVDLWSGSFLFQSATSTLLYKDHEVSGFEIKMDDGRIHSLVFFEHCLSGIKATLEFVSFRNYTIETLEIEPGRLKVSFTFFDNHSPVSVKIDRTEMKENTIHQIESLITDLKENTLWFKMNSTEILESLDHIKRTFYFLEEEVASLVDRLTVLSSYIQLATSHKDDPVHFESYRKHSLRTAEDLLDSISVPK